MLPQWLATVVDLVREAVDYYAMRFVEFDRCADSDSDRGSYFLASGCLRTCFSVNGVPLEKACRVSDTSKNDLNQLCAVKMLKVAKLEISMDENSDHEYHG